MKYKLAERLSIDPQLIDDWTLDQIESAWRGGKPRPKGIRVKSAADVRRLAETSDWRKAAGL